MNKVKIKCKMLCKAVTFQDVSGPGPMSSPGPGHLGSANANTSGCGNRPGSCGQEHILPCIQDVARCGQDPGKRLVTLPCAPKIPLVFAEQNLRIPCCCSSNYPVEHSRTKHTPKNAPIGSHHAQDIGFFG